ncbi:aminotransferase class III-fold pyridoxal phosphate-dependent enzyme, partial [candidate division KSB1 bacterium]
MLERLVNLSADELISEVMNLSESDTYNSLDSTIAHNYGIYPDFIPVKSEGPWLIDHSGKRYLDGVAAYSAANLGHNNQFVREVIQKFLDTTSPTVLGRFIASKPLAYAGNLLKEVSGFDCFLPANGGV